MLEDSEKQKEDTVPIDDLRLADHQRVLYEALIREDFRLGQMYLGALLVLGQAQNPERFVLAAHSLRELMEKFPKYLNLPVPKKSTRLTDKVKTLNKGWERTIKKSSACENPIPTTVIDQPLRRFIGDVKTFFKWFQSEHGLRKNRTTMILQSLDPLNRSLPKAIEDLRVKEWHNHFDYFVGVAHHRSVESGENFKSWVEALEHFLLDRLMPSAIVQKLWNYHNDLQDNVMSYGGCPQIKFRTGPLYMS